MTRVIKVGGRPQGDAALASLIAAAWAATPRSVVLVHGGGDEVTALQKAFGLSAQFVNGLRVTTARDMDLVRMALSGSANKRLVAALVQEGMRAVGLSGEDASLIAAMPADAGALGHVGEPRRVDPSVLWYLLEGGFLPVVSPVSRNVGATLGPVLNVNGDDAAAAIAVALQATELLFVSDVPGVLENNQTLPMLTVAGAQRLIGNGAAANGMAAKLRAAVAAVSGGVGQVRIGDLLAITDQQRGTRLTTTGIPA